MDNRIHSDNMIKTFALNLAHIANNELDTVVFINTGVTLVGQID